MKNDRQQSKLRIMSEVSRLIAAVAAGDRKAAAELLPLVYNQLRRLAEARMANEAAGQTLTATALVHEAYLRLVGPDGDKRFADCHHLFAAAAEVIRHILVDRARSKAR